MNTSTATTKETDNQEMTETHDDDDDNETYKKQLLDQLEKKVEEKSKWSWKGLFII